MDNAEPVSPAPASSPEPSLFWQPAILPPPKGSDPAAMKWILAAKVPSINLRQLPGMHESAGATAKFHDYPWWCCYAYAAQVAGTTDARELWMVSQQWLQGWCRQYALDVGKGQVPRVLEWMVSARADQIPM